MSTAQKSAEVNEPVSVSASVEDEDEDDDLPF
jgi:hypothetical protein